MEELFRTQPAQPVTAWILTPVNLTAHIPLWELRPWYARTAGQATDLKPAVQPKGSRP